MNLIQIGKVTLNSGKESFFKLECDQFIEDNVEGLALLISRIIGPFGSVEGVPQGGLKLAERMQQYVDDVAIEGVCPHLSVGVQQSLVPSSSLAAHVCRGSSRCSRCQRSCGYDRCK